MIRITHLKGSHTVSHSSSHAFMICTPQRFKYRRMQLCLRYKMSILRAQCHQWHRRSTAILLNNAFQAYHYYVTTERICINVKHILYCYLECRLIWRLDFVIGTWLEHDKLPFGRWRLAMPTFPRVELTILNRSLREMRINQWSESHI